MDIDLACEMAFSARDMDDSNGLFSHMEFEEVLRQKINALSKRLLLRKDNLQKRNESVKTDHEAVKYMKSNMYPFRRIFRVAESESAMVITLNPSYMMRKFVWVVNLLGANIKDLTSADYMVSWTEFNEIEDWFWINEHKIDSEMIKNALILYSKLCLPLCKFDTSKYKELVSSELYKDIVKQTAKAGIVPLRDCRLK